VPGLLVVVQTSKGSVDNVTAIQAGEVESGFSQSDVTWGAFSGTGIFAGRPPMQNLRALASLYLEGVHLVARAGSGIRTLADLRGRRCRRSMLRSAGRSTSCARARSTRCSSWAATPRMR
jgi:TRAP transporter TAXI family solute receptor